MKLTMDGIRDRAAWEKAGIALPGYEGGIRKSKKGAPVGALWHRQYFPYFHRRHR